jgi:inosine-uridine nucleoside N-ribohydrolase
MSERVIIDTDPGIDDAMAMLLALQSPELELAAVTTVSGNVPVEIATRNVFTVLSLLRGIQTPPVAMGRARPLQKQPCYATFLHGNDGLGNLCRLQDDAAGRRYSRPAPVLSQHHAVDEILFQIDAMPNAVTLIALGPLTNIADAIVRDKQTVAKVKRIVLMGGAISVSGNVTPVAEFNMFVDPHAARIVFDAGLPLTVVPLDVTRQVKLTRRKLAEAVALYPSPIGQFLLDCTRQAFSVSAERAGNAAICLHDPLAVGAVIDESFVSTEHLHVEIETAGNITEGMTVADRRPLKPSLKSPPNAAVCLQVDAPRFLSFFLDRVLRAKSPSHERSLTIENPR